MQDAGSQEQASEKGGSTSPLLVSEHTAPLVVKESPAESLWLRASRALGVDRVQALGEAGQVQGLAQRKGSIRQLNTVPLR